MNAVPLLIALALVAGAAYLFFLSASARKSARAIEAVRPVAIAEAQPGTPVRLEGWAAEAGPMGRAPLSGEACLWHAWSIDREYEKPKSSDSDSVTYEWRLQESGESREDFAIEDRAGGRIRVRPGEAEALSLGQSHVWYGTTPRPPPATPSAPADPGIVTKVVDMFRAGRYRYTEKRLMLGMPIFVVGLLEAPGPEDGANFRGRIGQGGGVPFLISGEAPEQAHANLKRDAKMTLWIGLALLAIAGAIAYFGIW